MSKRSDDDLDDDDLKGRRWVPFTWAMRYSGMSRNSLMRLVRSGRLKGYRPMEGRRAILIEKRDLDRLIAASRMQPAKTAAC
jgi:hypothetical protein